MSELLEVPQPRPMPSGVREAQCRVLEVIVARRTPPWRSRLSVLLAALTLTGGGVATAVQLWPERVTDRDTARCYSTAARDDGRGFPGTTVALSGRSLGERGQVDDALHLCSQLWRDGLLRLGNPDVQPPSDAARPIPAHPVPDLAGCVLPNGTAAVFPGDPQTCERLGLPELRS